MSKPLSPLPIIVDVHMHTLHSHGKASTVEMFEASLHKGLTTIGFSEHSPRPAGYTYPQDYQEQLGAGFPLYVAEVKKLQAKSEEHGARVLLGVEIDYIPGQEQYAQELCSAHDYDYIIGGLHFQGTWGFDASQNDWATMDTHARFTAYRQYYDDLTQMCTTGLFHVAAHPDLIKLFSVSSFHEWLDTPEALPLIEKTLIAIKENGMAMEISSAGLRKPCNEIYPCTTIMQVAQRLAVPISFASDAHCTNTPGYAFHELAAYASRFGYRESSVFIKRKNTIFPITVK